MLLSCRLGKIVRAREMHSFPLCLRAFSVTHERVIETQQQGKQEESGKSCRHEVSEDGLGRDPPTPSTFGILCSPIHHQWSEKTEAASESNRTPRIVAPFCDKQCQTG